MDFDKNTLRKIIREEIAGLPDEYIAESNCGLFQAITSLSEFISARNIFIYCSVEKEPDTFQVAKTALSMGKTVAYPLCSRGGLMKALAVDSLSELRPSLLGIPAPPTSAPEIAPEALDLVIVPALTYDRAGYRLGYGGGYYDRYLSGIPAVTVGMARERLLKNELPREPHDIAVMYVLTEFGVV